MLVDVLTFDVLGRRRRRQGLDLERDEAGVNGVPDHDEERGTTSEGQVSSKQRAGCQRRDATPRHPTPGEAIENATSMDAAAGSRNGASMSEAILADHQEIH